MDPITKHATIDAIRDQAHLGRTVFFTTHILQEAEELCDTIAIVDNGKCLALGDLQQIKSMARQALEVSVTFDLLTDAILAELQTLPLLKFAQKDNTVEMCIRGGEVEALELVTRLARGKHVVHVEVNSASLEDAFIELLGRRNEKAGDGEEPAT
jgi:ABC-2 type transport system ATP-binding protein